MPWREATVVSQRMELVTLALQPGANVSELCRRFGIAPKTAYKWIDRFEKFGPEGLVDRSRRPHSSPGKADSTVEDLVLALRDKHPAWGGRKLRRRLLDLGHQCVPMASTITEILRRNGRIDPAESEQHTPYQRFEHMSPNDLWQMDFKGEFVTDVGWCYPLTALDDHSRYSIILQACGDRRTKTVQTHLTAAFERYGLPRRILVDHGPPWSGGGSHLYTPLTVWMIRLGIGITRSRVCHPQTQGKEERFHKTLKRESIGARQFADLAECQGEFVRWRHIYNHERPHEAIGMATPATRYEMSPRAYPRQMPPIEYGAQDHVRKVQQCGWLSFRGGEYRVSKAFAGYPVGIRPTISEGVFDIYFCTQMIGHIDLATRSVED